MAARKSYNVTALNDGSEIASVCAAALAEACKALKAFSFYPETHPLRDKILQGAYDAMATLLRSGRVSLFVQRNGFAFADREAAIVNTPMTAALAHELFSRELQQLILLPELSIADFTGFISLLSTEPQKISAAGGLAAMLKSSGIFTVIVNEIDITAVFTKKKVGVADDASASGTAAPEQREEDDSQWSAPSDLSDTTFKELSIEELLARMAEETDDTAYRQLAQKLVAKGQPLKVHGEFERLYPVLVAMSEQHADAARSRVHRDCALMVMQQLALGEPAERLLDALQEESSEQKEIVAEILVQLGADVVDAVLARLIDVADTSSRKLLTTVVSRIGRPALPALNDMLNDKRWQVVHTAVTVLGEIGSREAVRGLSITLLHYDARVRLETIRALARIGGIEATNLLLDLLKGKDETVALQVIASLGNFRNHRGLQPLLQLVQKGDLRGRLHKQKREAIVAIGRIGDRRALDPLFKLVQKRHWLTAGRSDELKVVALEAIGLLGGNRADAFLEEISAQGGALGRTAAAALETLAQKKATRDE